MPSKHRLLNLLDRLIHRGTQQQFNLLFHKYHEVDIAEALSLLPYDQQVLFFSRLTAKKTVDIFEEMDVDDQIEIIQGFKAENAANLIEKMDKDDGVDLLEALLDEDRTKAQDILSRMDVADQIEMHRLLSYPDDSAGSMMSTEMLAIPENLLVSEALARYKAKMPRESDAAFYLFIVNHFNQIKGLISIRKLLLAPPDQRVSDIRNSYPITVHVSTNKEQVANIFKKYRSIVLPVVDDVDVLLGVITIDDGVDVMMDAANEDMLKLSGTSGDIGNDKLIKGPINYALIHRLPWLIVTIFGGIVSSSVMLYYAKTLAHVPVSMALIISFVPLLMGLGGNIGNQSATILVRAMALSSFDWHQKLRVVIREMVIGVIIGLVISTIVGGYVYWISVPAIALCIGVSVVINMATASLVGSALPIILKTFNVDPAIASTPFISTTLDIVGQIVYFSTFLVIFGLWL